MTERPAPGPSDTSGPAVDPWAALRAAAAAALVPALASLGWSGSAAEVEKALETGPEAKADVALPVFRWAKALRMRPEEISQKVAGQTLPPPGFLKVEAAGGFVNLFLDARAFAGRTLELVLGRGSDYGKGNPKPGSVCVEHTSANPTGQLHVGRSRNTIIGDTYARVLRAAGWKVTVQFYVDDVGRQAAMLVWLWSQPMDQWPPQVREKAGLSANGNRPPEMKADQWYGRPYPATAEYLKGHPEAAQSLAELSHRLESGKVPTESYRRVPQEILDGILASLARIHAGFDEFVWESQFILDGSVERVQEKLRRSPLYHKAEDGAEAVDGSAQGLPKEQPMVFFTKADGLTLYPARDAAYHLQKFAHFDRVIDVLGSDHKLHVRGLLALLAAAGERRQPEVLVYEFVNLPEGRMTTRGGRVVNLDDALDEAVERASLEVRKRREDLNAEEVERIAESVGCGALRFHILKVQPEKPIVFRWEEALSFEGKSAPFVQYAHARAASLLRRSAGGDDAPMPKVGAPRLEEVPAELDPRELALLRTLSQLPGLVDRVASSGSVHLVAVYAHEVAERFNEFYQSVRVLEGDPAARTFRIALVAATRQTLENVLDLIGVDPLMRM